mmetsp:Transcript_63317/g.117801  ORF Transcript_63317/g.117801 Transcript_63317/m.117801 type:complete len:252 (+) Transcript_63317:389-1144(+)
MDLPRTDGSGTVHFAPGGFSGLRQVLQPQDVPMLLPMPGAMKAVGSLQFAEVYRFSKTAWLASKWVSKRQGWRLFCDSFRFDPSELPQEDPSAEVEGAMTNTSFFDDEGGPMAYLYYFDGRGQNPGDESKVSMTLEPNQNTDFELGVRGLRGMAQFDEVVFHVDVPEPGSLEMESFNFDPRDASPSVRAICSGGALQLVYAVQFAKPLQIRCSCSNLACCKLAGATSGCSKRGALDHPMNPVVDSHTKTMR